MFGVAVLGIVKEVEIGTSVPIKGIPWNRKKRNSRDRTLDRLPMRGH